MRKIKGRRYIATEKGRQKASQKRIVLTAPSLNYVAVLQYLAIRKTPATIREIWEGVQPKSRLGKLFLGMSAPTPNEIHRAITWGVNKRYINAV